MRAANVRINYHKSKRLIYNYFYLSLYDLIHNRSFMFDFLHITLIDILDILMVALIIFFAFRWIKGTTAINIFLAIIIVLLIRILASALGMRMISTIIDTIINVGTIGLVIIFQPELRRFLSSLGRKVGNTIENRSFLKRFLSTKNIDSLKAEAITEIAEACMEMSEQKTGALIILRKNESLEDVIATGDRIDATISRRLIMNIFFKNSPLHDGAMIIGGDRILAARCTLPISDRTNLPARFGMRHKAAVGISEQSDAAVVVVSEQTGRISYVKAGVITAVDSINKLKLLLSE